ncbi:hypothetical protein ACFE04_029169 [Oxalis oulophora]
MKQKSKRRCARRSKPWIDTVLCNNFSNLAVVDHHKVVEPEKPQGIKKKAIKNRYNPYDFTQLKQTLNNDSISSKRRTNIIRVAHYQKDQELIDKQQISGKEEEICQLNMAFCPHNSVRALETSKMNETRDIGVSDIDFLNNNFNGFLIE